MNAFGAQLRQELAKLFSRPRTYLGFGGLFLLECTILFLVNRPESKTDFRRLLQQYGLGFDPYFSGLTLATEMVAWTSFMPGALFLALVSGDVMSSEVEEGTLRMMLCRPISRVRLVWLKYFSCVAYTFALIGFLGVTSLVLGIMNHGAGGLFVLSTSAHVLAWHEPAAGAIRFCAAVALLTLNLTAVASLGLLFSCLNIKPAAAVTATIAILLIDCLSSNVPYFENLRPYFLSTHIAGWLQIFANPIPWTRLAADVSILIAFQAACLASAIALFRRRDIKT